MVEIEEKSGNDKVIRIILWETIKISAQNLASLHIVDVEIFLGIRENFNMLVVLEEK